MTDEQAPSDPASTPALQILHVYKTYPPIKGGIEYHLRLLAEAQAAEGHAVTVLVTGLRRRTTESTENGVRVVRAGNLATVASTPLSVALFGALAKEGPDVTHLHLPYPVAELAWLLAGRQPMVASYHADVVRQRLLRLLWSPGQQRLLGAARRILVSNPVMMATSAPLAAHRERLALVPYGIDVRPFAAPHEGHAAGGAALDTSARHERDADDPAGTDRAAPGGVLVFVGRLRYYKGLWVLVRALALVPEARLLVVGEGPEGAALRREADELGVSGRISWLGDVEDARLPGVLSSGDVFVFPSVARSEAFGISQVEAMAAGLPVISTELGTGTSWVNQHGVTGLVVPPADPVALAAAVKTMLGDDALRARLGAGARDRALAEFTRERMVARIDDIYESVRGTA